MMSVGKVELVCCVLATALASSAMASVAPEVKHKCQSGGAFSLVHPLVNPTPRPCDAATNVSTDTTLYFEVLVPTSNPLTGRVDPASITALLLGNGQTTPMLTAGQTWAPGYSGSISEMTNFDGETGFAVWIQIQTPLASSSPYTVSVFARNLDGTAIESSTAWWSFTTRPALSGTETLDIDLGGTTVHWTGQWYGGQGQVSFDGVDLLNQRPLLDMMDQARVLAPEFLLNERPFGLNSSYYLFFPIEADPNIVREIQTRRVTAVADHPTGATALTVTDLAEGPLYGIPPGRTVDADYHAGDEVVLCEGFTPDFTDVCQTATVQSATGYTVVVTQLNAASTWTTAVTYGWPDSPLTPDYFPWAYLTLRKLDPPGQLVFYWRRLEHELDALVAHKRRPQINFIGTPFDLCPRATGGGDDTGGACLGSPKDWVQWNQYVVAVTDHLVVRYGAQTADWYFSIGNEEDRRSPPAIRTSSTTTTRSTQ